MTEPTSNGPVHHSGLSGWWHLYLRHRYEVLFYSLLLTLIGEPIVKAFGFTGDLLQVLVGLNLLAAALPLSNQKGRRVLQAILLAAIMLRIVSLHVGHAGLTAATLVLWTGIGLYTVFVILRFVLRSPAITPEHLYAALSAYLVAGVFLGVLYYGLDHLWPGSVAISGEDASSPFSLSRGIYFSFITLATVGYGDLVPGNDIVRGLAIVEAIAGQFYLAVMIARLMSLYMRETR